MCIHLKGTLHRKKTERTFKDVENEKLYGNYV